MVGSRDKSGISKEEGIANGRCYNARNKRPAQMQYAREDLRRSRRSEK
jgi:hypothetical protein